MKSQSEEPKREVLLIALLVALLASSLTSSAALGGDMDRAAGIIRLQAIPGNTDCPVITAMDISPDGRFLSAAGDDHAVRLLELPTQNGSDATAYSLAANNSTASGSGATDERLWEPISRFTWTLHSDWVRAVRFSPSGKLVASCGNDGRILVHEVASGNIAANTLVDHALQDLCFASDDTIYAVGFDANVYRWNIAQPHPTVDHSADCQDLRTIQFSPELQMLAYGGRDGVLRLYHVREGKTEVYALSPAHYSRIRSLQFLPDQRTLLSVGEDRRLIQYDIPTKAIISTSDFPGGKLFGLTSIDPDQLAIAGADNTIKLLDAKTGQVRAKLIGHDGTVTLLHARGGVLVSSSFDTTIRIWNIDRAARECDDQKRYYHPVAAQFEDSGALEKPGILVSKPNQ
ncbi:WD40 repeat domain-containing protein [Pirellulaceae bacterium SH449]